MTGLIRKLVSGKFFGFIVGDDGKEYFFHGSALVSRDFNDLHEGEKVTFRTSEGQKGPRAEEIEIV